jgi:glycosyltransferase involved in cell wall biosynthesis
MFEPLIQELADNKDFSISGIMPSHGTRGQFPFDVVFLETPFPIWVPGVIRNLLYDLFIFPNYIRSMNPELVLSPYFDVHIPKKVRSIITIHDMCFFEVPTVYGVIRRYYFMWRTKISARNSIAILTDSFASKNAITKFLSVPSEKIYILPNRISEVFASFNPSELEIKHFKSTFSLIESDRVLLYTGGFENRKNLSNLLLSFKIAQGNGWVDKLLITGAKDRHWHRLVARFEINSQSIVFTGHLDSRTLRIAYATSNALIYPSLSEGFGRPNLEAQFAGIPITCSDIPVFREVCGENAVYFDPNDVSDIASSIQAVMEKNSTLKLEKSNFEQNTLAAIISKSGSFK